MAKIGGTVKTVSQQTDEKKFYYGIFHGVVKAINPDRSALNALEGKEDSEEDKEIRYTEIKDGTRIAHIHVYLQVMNQGVEELLAYKFKLVDEIRINKDKDKVQLINCVGKTTWVLAEEGNEEEDIVTEHVYFTPTLFYDINRLDLGFMNFTKVLDWQNKDSGETFEKYQKGCIPGRQEVYGTKEYRPALKGEEQLLDFMKAWLSRIKLDVEDANLLLETDELFAGNFTDLTSLIESTLDSEERGGVLYPVGFVGLAYVNTDEEDSQKRYQKVFSSFLPAYFMKSITAKGAKFTKPKSQDMWNKFLKDVEGEYGVDGAYVLTPIQVYDPTKDVAARTETKNDPTGAASVPFPANLDTPPAGKETKKSKF